MTRDEVYDRFATIVEHSRAHDPLWEIRIDVELEARHQIIRRGLT